MCFLRVHGTDLALAVYQDTCALESRNDAADQGFRWVIVDAASQPGVTIFLTKYQHGGESIGVHSDTNDLGATFEKVGNFGAALRSRT